MKRIAIVFACLCALVLLMACPQSTSIVDQLKYADTPAWSPSNWAGSALDGSASYPSITKTVTTVAAGHTAYSDSVIPLKTIAYSLALKADNSFTFTMTSGFSANWANNYISDQFLFSTDPGIYTPPTSPPVTGTSYDYNLINGQVYYFYSSSLPSSSLVASIGTATVDYTYFEGEINRTIQVYPVTFIAPTTVGAIESGKAYETMTYTGTYKTVNVSSSPINGSTVPVLATLSSTDQAVTYSNVDGTGTALPIITGNYITDTDPLTGMFDFEYGKAPNPSGDLVYAIAYGSSRVMPSLSLKSAGRGSSSSSVVLYQQ